jgi:UDP-N-acetylmuramoylalanine--D-glutamate ligase
LNKRIVILGGAESGVGAAILAQKQGFEVFVSDMSAIKDKYKRELMKRNIPFEEQQHSEEKILNASEIIKSPGIPHKATIIKKAIEINIPIISEIEFGSRYTTSKIVAITGSNGKSTCTSLTYHIFKKAGLDVGLGGNIGNSFAQMVAEEPHDIYVLEVSSFQLDDTTSFKPYVSILLNITPDHLDRYDYTFSKYANAKFNIAKYQTASDYFIYCSDDEGINEFIPHYNIQAQTLTFSLDKKENSSAYIENNYLTLNHKPSFTMLTNDLSLKGTHNLYNSMAAGLASKVFDLKKDIIRESLMDFKGLEHRLEFVAKIQGVEYINDSKATNVNSVWYALESMNKPVIWIAGGVDKGNEYEVLQPLVKKKVKAIVCLGKDNLKIHEAFSRYVDMIANTNSAQDAVRMAHKIAAKGDVVLLSPACASFDLFQNYEERGTQFKQAVLSL